MKTSYNDGKMINETNKEEWPAIILGIRKNLDLSQTQLSKKLHIGRQSIGRFEALKRTPNKKSSESIINFIIKSNLDINKLKELGNDYVNEFKKREKFTKLELKPSSELAELIGIILGDGEIRKDGSIRVSFDPKKDKNFLYRRVIPLIHNLVGNNISYDKSNRIGFWNISLTRYLKEDCNLNLGSKFENNWGIPKWCFEKEEYLNAVLRGLFDTDGYFGYFNGSLELMFGRFSDRCTNLVDNIEYALNILNFNPIVKHTKDGRYRIRIQNKKDVVGFFSKIGTSNLKHIVRFLLWRISAYEAKIEIEGLNSLINKTNKLIDFEIKNVKLPFRWGLTRKTEFSQYLENDVSLISKRRRIRKAFK